jgi:hypothetical protein
MQLRQGFPASIGDDVLLRQAAGLFNMPGSSDSNRKRGQEHNPALPRHFALDFGLEQSMHGGHGHRA